MTSAPATTATFCATLVDEWVRLGVKHCVISPGSRSTPMAIALSQNDAISVHVFHDERSASFAALGIGVQSGKPAVLLCTSGTAAAQFFAAVIEAHYAHVPMLVCTADRPPELQGVGAPQTINQQNLYGAFVRKFIDTGVADDAKKSQWRSFARDAFASTVGVNRGPCQINLPFREPLVGEADALPPVDAHSPIRMTADVASARERKELSMMLRAEQGVIIAGNGIDDPRFILELAAKLQWPVIADPRSNCRVGTQDCQGAVVVSTADAMLRYLPTATNLAPVAVLRIGDPPVSKVVNQWLTQCGAQQIAVTAQPSLIDPDKVVSSHIVASYRELFLELARGTDQRAINHWVQQWRIAEDASRKSMDEALAISRPLTEPVVAATLSSQLSVDSQLFVSSSMPIRDIEWFSAPRSGLRVLSNRGVNGIDGVVSSAVGAAIASQSATALLIGDVAFLHDSNALIALTKRNIDLLIVVIDNDGGGIFSFLPQASQLPESQFEQLFGTPHGADFAQLCSSFGIPFSWATDTEQLCDAIVGKGIRVVGVRTDRKQNVQHHQQLNEQVANALASLG